jgi:HD-GYP domain-containing protein (c-di-GMP phosphodiesterase class II)
MKSIQLSDLKPGTVAENELYSEKGELLIARGVPISNRIISLMEKRNVFNLYFKSENETEDLDKIITDGFGKLDQLDFGEERLNAATSLPRPQFVHVPIRPPKALEQPEIRDIRKGKQGLNQLLQYGKALELDKIARTRNLPDRPFGVPIEKKASQIQVKERTDEYKTTVSSSYEKALKETTDILTSIADGAWCDARQIRSIVEQFARMFVTDHCVLLNISGTKHSDEYIFHHTLNVCLLSINIAAGFGYSEQQIVEIGMGALLHDIGMLLIPDSIRFKQQELTEDERYEIQKHPILGLHLLEKVKKLPWSVPYVAYHSHERENGKGYPKQRNGHLIHGFAKVVQLADMYEAMSSPRPYHQAMLPFRAIAHLISLSRTGDVAPGLLKALLKYISLFPVGSLVELSDHAIGKVIQGNNTSYSKPVISVLTDKKGSILPHEQIYQVDLVQATEISIIRALPFDYLNGVGIMDGF